METAKPRELKTLHVGKTRTTYGSKSHHGLRKWNSSLHHASSLKSFRTAFTHTHSNCKTGGKRYHQRSHVSCPRESVCLLRLMSGIRKVSEVGLPCVVFSLHTRTYTKYRNDNLNYRSEKRLKRLQNDSTMALISFTKVAREAGAISFWLVYSSNIEGEININKTSRSFSAA